MKHASDMVMENTFSRDGQYQIGYLYDYYHDVGTDKLRLYNLNPAEDENKIPIECKMVAHTSQTYNKDSVTFHLQFKPSQRCNVPYYDESLAKPYDAMFPIGLYIDLMDDKDQYNRWLIVNTANYWNVNFPTYEVLQCDRVYQWIDKGKKYQCAGVMRSQNSQIVRFMGETPCRKFSNCWEHSLGYQYRYGDNLINRVNQQRSL